MKKLYCDRCEKIIDDPREFHLVKFQESNEDSYSIINPGTTFFRIELCSDCWPEFKAEKEKIINTLKVWGKP